MTKLIEVGQKAHMLTIINEMPIRCVNGRHKARYVRCLCDCGKEAVIVIYSFGRNRSCGCIVDGRTTTTHGESKGGRMSKEYSTRLKIINRCHKSNTQGYENYGGRGIAVCEDWRNSFEAFLRDMGRAPSPQHSIDRIDNEKGYSPENCRWATWNEQARNRRKTRFIEYGGRRLCLTEWAEITGLRRQAICVRIDELGWTIGEALGFEARELRPGNWGKRK